MQLKKCYLKDYSSCTTEKELNTKMKNPLVAHDKMLKPNYEIVENACNDINTRSYM